jgi:PAS domain-containing protein
MSKADKETRPEALSMQALHARLENANRQLRQQTETLHAQQERIDALVASQNELESVLRTAKHAFLVIGDDDTIRHANPVFRSISEQLLDRLPEPGDPVHDFVRDQDREAFGAHLAKARKGETVDIVRSFSSVSETGEETRWFRFVYAPVSWRSETD